jgi:protein transport protein SEC31
MESVSKNGNWNEGVESMIKKNLMFGNIQYAAEVALKCGRTTEALLIAEQGGADLVNEIKEKFFEQQKDPFIRTTLKAIVNKDLDSLIEDEVLRDSSPNKPVNWKETLAYIYAYEESPSDRNDMIRELGDKLVGMKEITPAIVCYIMSESITETLDLWKRRALHNINSKEQTRERSLFDLLKKFTLFKLALETNGNRGLVENNQDFALILTEIGRYMASDE